MKAIPTVRTDYPMLKNADNLEEILCMAMLLAMGKLHLSYLGLMEVNAYFEKIGNDCSNCEYAPKCLACVINE